MREKSGLCFQLSKVVRVVLYICKQHSLLIVWSTEDLVVKQVELITNTEPDETGLDDLVDTKYISPTCVDTAGKQSTPGDKH